MRKHITPFLYFFIRAKRISNCHIQKKNCACVRVSVCSINLGFSGGSACVRLILVLVGGRQTPIVVALYNSMIPATYNIGLHQKNK